MKRTSIHLTDEQRERLDAKARAEKVSRSEGSFGVLDEEFLLDRHDGARGAHLEQISGR